MIDLHPVHGKGSLSEALSERHQMHFVHQDRVHMLGALMKIWKTQCIQSGVRSKAASSWELPSP